jgi:ankyrin repeat protein
VEVLLQHNANVNAKTNKRGITPLIFSVKARDLVTARMLLEHGANVNAQTSRTKYTALIAAVRNKDEVQPLSQVFFCPSLTHHLLGQDMIKLLLEFNADPCLTCHMVWVLLASGFFTPSSRLVPYVSRVQGRNAFDYAEEEGIDYLRIPSTTPVQAI